jgi:hypothetical protein
MRGGLTAVMVLALTLPGVAAADPGAVPAGMTAESVIARHIEARGGRKAWDAVRSMRLTGQYAAFSDDHPFTLLLKRDGKFLFDHFWTDKRVVVGSDGKTVWTENLFMEEGAQLVEGLDRSVALRTADFPTPFFDYEARGYKVKLLGELDLEGQKTIGLELTRGEGDVETWHLDPGTWLEVARDATGSDFGRPQPERTYFDDFRRVGSVVVPHLVDTQWYTRNRVMKVGKIDINPDVADAEFNLPPPPGMAKLLPMVGKWEIAFARRNNPNSPWEESKRQSSMEPLLGGAILQERVKTAEGGEILRTLSYDKYRKQYRVTQISDRQSFLDIEEGTFGEDGRLVVSNEKSGTTQEVFGTTVHSRLAFFEIGENGFKIEVDVSVDGGKNWFTAAKADYTRAPQ